MQASQASCTVFCAKTLDQVDLIWNNLKIAEISRKHGLPRYASRILKETRDSLAKVEVKGDVLKLERFKLTYETFKQQMAFRSLKRAEVQAHLTKTIQEIDNADYDPWMQAELARIVGE